MPELSRFYGIVVKMYYNDHSPPHFHDSALVPAHNKTLNLTANSLANLVNAFRAAGWLRRSFIGLTVASRMPETEIVIADLADSTHQDAVLSMLNAYSADPMGDEQPLSEFALANLIAGLRKHPTTRIFLAMRNDRPVGIAVCFRGFSTFAAMPLINVHDFYVEANVRGRGIGRSLLAAIEHEGLATGCCKLTLEVQENNSRARSMYIKFGFAQAVYAADAESGGSLFMTKPIA